MIRSLRNIICVLLGTMLAAGCSSSASAASASPSATASPVHTIILFTNDAHGHILNDASEPSWGLARIAKEKEDLIEAGYQVYLFSAGDDIQGTPLVSMDQGSSVIRFMGDAGYDLMEIGNHELDYGMDTLLALQEAASFPMLAANVQRTVGGDSVFAEHQEYTAADGMKIGVFGLATPETATKANPIYTAGLTFLAGDQLYQKAQEQIDLLKKDGCSLIICLGHLGVDDSSSPNRSIDVIQNTSGINVFIDGHSHTEVNETVGSTLLVQTGSNSHNLGRLEIHADGTYSAALMPAVDVNNAVNEEINDYNDEVEKQLSVKFAETAVSLDGERNDVRTMETNLGDLTCDALSYEAEKLTGTAPDVTITNGGSIRASIPAGDITLKTVRTVFPFSNTLVTLKVTGSELLEALEAATCALPDSIGGFPQVAGVEFSVDTTVPYQQGEQYPDSTYFKPAAPGSRVTIASVGGRPFDPDALYTLAANDFIGAGGDTYYALKYAYENSGYNTGIGLEDCLSDYISSELGGIVGDSYASAQGRIAIRS